MLQLLIIPFRRRIWRGVDGEECKRNLADLRNRHEAVFPNDVL